MSSDQQTFEDSREAAVELLLNGELDGFVVVGATEKDPGVSINYVHNTTKEDPQAETGLTIAMISGLIAQYAELSERTDRSDSGVSPQEVLTATERQMDEISQ